MLSTLLEKIQHSDAKSPAHYIEKNMSTSDNFRYWSTIDIQDNHEPLIDSKGTALQHFDPHYYSSVGAPYENYAPSNLRKSVLERLLKAQQNLQDTHPSYSLKIFDGYRPLAVQSYMVNYEYEQLAHAQGLDINQIDDETHSSLMQKVLGIWAKPNEDLRCPPPHSTGGAVDLTIVDENGEPLDMGSEIDAIAPETSPNYFEDKTAEDAQHFHQNRELLRDCMHRAGFRRHPHEWWHFSYGDQIWAMLEWLDTPDSTPLAHYGRVEK